MVLPLEYVVLAAIYIKKVPDRFHGNDCPFSLYKVTYKLALYNILLFKGDCNCDDYYILYERS